MFIWPVPGYHVISSDYYDQRDYGLHGAIDIPAPAVPCVALDYGTVIFEGWAGSAGRSVYIDLDNGHRVHYCHLSSIGVPLGKWVTPGSETGLIGGSGHGVDNYYGSHLHLNLFAATQPATGPSHWVGWVGMWAVDPELYLGQEDDVLTDTDKEWFIILRNDGVKMVERAIVDHFEKVEKPYLRKVRGGALNHIDTWANARTRKVLEAIKAISAGGGPSANQIIDRLMERLDD